MAGSDGGPPLPDPLRVDQVGSLLRPEALKAVYARRDAGLASEDEVCQAQDEAVRAVVGRQEALGLPVVTDGEYRRLNFQDSFGASVAGLTAPPATLSFHRERIAGARPLQRWDTAQPGAGGGVVVRSAARERIRLGRNVPLEEYRFASAAARCPVKVTLIGPDRVVERFDLEGSAGVYRDRDDYAQDVVAVDREIVGALIDAGCRYVQIDEPSYTRYVDGPSLEAMRSRGEDPEQALERGIAADNAIIAPFAGRGVTFGVHVCRGNQRSMWHREGSYDAVAERLFSGLQHDRLLLEYDSERAGGFEPLRHVPRGKIVVLGLVSTKVPRLETVDELLRRIDDASRYLPVEQLALSPQCGFASDVLGNLLSEDDQWRKLERVLEVAERVWS